MVPMLILTQATPQLLSFAILCAMTGMVFLTAICTLCRRKRRKKRSVLPDGMMLVDVSLLRQTQLRSLSKSDTKLHELKSTRFNEKNTRPLSMDYPHASTPDRGGGLKGYGERTPPNRVLPSIPYVDFRDDSRTLNHIYSTLKIESEFRPPVCVMPTSVMSTAGEAAASSSAPQVTKSEDTAPVMAEYACVKKLKKDTPAQVCNQEEYGNVQALSGDSTRPLGDTQAGTHEVSSIKLEEMYSTVCKRGKKEHNDHTHYVQENMALEKLPYAQKAELQTWCPPNAVQRDSEPTKPSPTTVLESEPAYETIDKPWTRGSVQTTIDVFCSRVGRKGKTGTRNTTENLYESISEAKEALPSEGMGTRKTNNGFEAYLTGL